MSSLKKLVNEIQELRDKSHIQLSHDEYYIVYINILYSNNSDFMNSINKLCNLIGCNTIYIYKTQSHIHIHLLLKPHLEIYKYFKVTSELISYIITFIVQEIGLNYSDNTFINASPIVCECIKFDTKIQIYTYFVLQLIQNTRNSMIEFSNGVIDNRDVVQLTRDELMLKIQNYTDWESIPHDQKYGQFGFMSNSVLELHNIILTFTNKDDHTDDIFR